MSTRQIRNRKVLRLECLEVRNAPSHFGVIGHAALALHQVHAAAHVSQVHAAAHVSQVNDSPSSDKYQAPEEKTATDKSVDPTNSETNSNDSPSTDKHHTPEVKSGTDKSMDPTSSETNSPDPSSPDPNSVDPAGNR